jgi:hypothetical protein
MTYPGQQYPPPPQGHYPPQGWAPPPAPKKTRKWPWIVGGVVGFIVLLSAIGGNSAPPPSSTTGATGPVLALEDGQVRPELLDSRGGGLRLDVVNIPLHGGELVHMRVPNPSGLSALVNQNLKRVHDLTQLSPVTLFPEHRRFHLGCRRVVLVDVHHRTKNPAGEDRLVKILRYWRGRRSAGPPPRKPGGGKGEYLGTSNPQEVRLSCARSSSQCSGSAGACR